MIFSSERAFYFAYGSNMCGWHMAERIRSAKLIGVARLKDYIWCCNKLGKDGTAKANLMDQESASVWGVLYSIKAKQWKRLDQIENGYQRIEIDVDCQGEMRRAYTYQSSLITHHAPSDLYMSLVIDGLLEHKMSADYVSEIRREAGI